MKKYDRTKYTGIYTSWYAMKQRCDNSSNKGFKNYGGRGIKYEDRWQYFGEFRKDMNESYKTGLTLERIDNNFGYSKDNCRWATRKEQCNNRRNTLNLTFKGETYPMTVWAEKLGIGFGTLRSRYYRGMNLDEIFKPSLYRPAKL